MTRQHSSRSAEDHAPGQVGVCAPQLAVDEVGASAQEQPDGRGDDAHVSQRQVWDAREFRGDEASEQRTHEAAMEAHAPMVESQQFKRVLKIVVIAVEQAVTQPRADDDADDDAADDGQQRIGIELQLPPLGEPPHEQAGE